MSRLGLGRDDTKALAQGCGCGLFVLVMWLIAIGATFRVITWATQ